MMIAATCGVPEHKLRVDRAVGGRRLRLEAQRVRRGAHRRGAGPAAGRAAPAGPRAAPRRRVATIQGRGQVQHIELAADAEGKVTAVRVKLLADMGAYMQLVTPGIPLLGAFLYHGVYDVPAYHFECTGVFTNLHAHRRLPGRRSARGHLRRRAGHGCAGPRGRASTGAEIRRRNYIAPDKFPVRVHRRAHLRLGQLRARRSTGRSSWSATTTCGPSSSGGARPARPSTWASASPPTSRCAAWRPAGCWRR